MIGASYIIKDVINPIYLASILAEYCCQICDVDDGTIECELLDFHEPYGFEVEVMQNLGVTCRVGPNRLNIIEISRKAQLAQLFINLYILDWSATIKLDQLVLTWRDNLIAFQTKDHQAGDYLIDALNAVGYLECMR
jgi:hypothetical protein